MKHEGKRMVKLQFLPLFFNTLHSNTSINVLGVTFSFSDCFSRINRKGFNSL